MKIGYPCINTSIGCSTNSTFRLSGYSEDRLYAYVLKNLNCLKNILEWNLKNNILFFRIGSSLVPFASHPVCKADWQSKFKEEFRSIGRFVMENNMRVSVHPDQFVIINSPNNEIVKNSILELEYHCQMLDLMELSKNAKIQIHIGGVYGDKKTAIDRFISNYRILDPSVKQRLAIENDHRLFSLSDCLYIHEKSGIPVIFDAFHHACLNNGEFLNEAMKLAINTWLKTDGFLIVDYSDQADGSVKGSHSQHVDIENFQNFINQTEAYDFDLMLEIKDKEKSAIEVIRLMSLRSQSA